MGLTIPLGVLADSVTFSSTGGKSASKGAAVPFASRCLGGETVSEIILARRPEDLDTVIHVLHDCWFDKDEIRFDPATAILTFRFTKPGTRKPAGRRRLLLKRIEVPYFESFLRIHRVQSWTVEDTEQVGIYDFNEIRFDSETKRIEITTGVPLSIVVQVEHLELEVEVTQTVVAVRTNRKLEL
jgi:hypothetical protein